MTKLMRNNETIHLHVDANIGTTKSALKNVPGFDNDGFFWMPKWFYFIWEQEIWPLMNNDFNNWECRSYRRSLNTDGFDL
jgi:hypothetical protein